MTRIVSNLCNPLHGGTDKLHLKLYRIPRADSAHTLELTELAGTPAKI
ncbi:hypothetical protein GCM10009789_77270 [Kribbella sancticallisti]|uniref:Uncharacterized protein n=1 Tax=Kribbella sancticallisti TaxID=460087 RepID=A0ABP4QK96_9ACTN